MGGNNVYPVRIVAQSRLGGQRVSFNGTADASVTLPAGATGFRGLFSNRQTSGAILLIGYAPPPLTEFTASWITMDFGVFNEDVLEGTTIYFHLVSSDDMVTPVEGGAFDCIYLTFYGEQSEVRH